MFAVLVSSGVAIRAVFGPLPYPLVVAIVELIKIIFALNLAVLNASHIVQFVIILNFR